MNEEQYLTFNIYDEAEVNDTLRFAPTLGWKLFSLQDIYSRSDAYHVTSYGEKDSGAAAKKSWSGNFADAVNDNDYSSLDYSGEGIETHITSYSKMVLIRSASEAQNSNSKIEDVWVLFMRLLTKIGKRADNIDGLRASATSSKKNKGTGSFVWGMLLTILGGLTAGGGAYLKAAGDASMVSSEATTSEVEVSALIARAVSSSEETISSSVASSDAGSSSVSMLSKIIPFANYVLYAGIGVAVLGILLLIIGIISISNGNKLNRQCRHGINECIKDYRDVKAAKKAFEGLVSQGQQTSVNLRWLYNLCLKYGVSYPSSLKK